MSDVIDDILERMNIVHMCTYESLAFKPLTVVTDVINKLFDMFQYCTYNAKYRATNRKDSFTLK